MVDVKTEEQQFTVALPEELKTGLFSGAAPYYKTLVTDHDVKIDTPKGVGQLHFPRGDMDKFSMARWLYQSAVHKYNPAQLRKAAPFEYAYYAAVMAKAQQEAIGMDGGFLAPEEWRLQFDGVIRDGLAMKQLGYPVLRTGARVTHLPIGASEWNFTWVSEGQAANLTQHKYAQKSLTFRKCQAYAKFSLELFRDASDFGDQFLQKDAGRGVSFQIDQMMLTGTGGLQPAGLANSPQVSNVALNATPTLANFATGITNAETLNGNPNGIPTGSTSDVIVVGAPRIKQTIRSMVNGANQGTLPWLFGLGTDPIQRFLGTSWVLTAAVPINAGSGAQSYIFYGDWKHALVGLRTDFQFDISDQPDFATGQYTVRVIFRMDTVALHPEAFFVHSQVNP